MVLIISIILDFRSQQWSSRFDCIVFGGRICQTGDRPWATPYDTIRAVHEQGRSFGWQDVAHGSGHSRTQGTPITCCFIWFRGMVTLVSVVLARKPFPVAVICGKMKTFLFSRCSCICCEKSCPLSSLFFCRKLCWGSTSVPIRKL